MMPVHVAKIVVALVGLLVFFAGTQTGMTWLRWAGIVLVAAAWLLRFYRPSRPSIRPSSPPEESP